MLAWLGRSWTPTFARAHDEEADIGTRARHGSLDLIVPSARLLVSCVIAQFREL
jgi:hypothetical protein